MALEYETVDAPPATRWGSGLGGKKVVMQYAELADANEGKWLKIRVEKKGHTAYAGELKKLGYSSTSRIIEGVPYLFVAKNVPTPT